MDFNNGYAYMSNDEKRENEKKSKELIRAIYDTQTHNLPQSIYSLFVFIVFIKTMRTTLDVCLCASL